MLKFLGHAGFMYETNNEVLLMDPWMSEEGAFDSSWYQFPSNHALGDQIRKEIESTEKEIYIYISHEHKDHFDVPYLKTLNLSKVNFITPKFRRDHVAHVLNTLNPKSVITPVDSELLNIGNMEIRLFLDDQEIVRDSALGLIDKDRDFTFVNLNDCKVYDRVDELKNIFKKFDIFTCQFSGAVFHPVCYDYPEKKYKEISESKVLGKFSSVKNLISKFEPSLYIPAAGPPVFLDPKLIDINFQDVKNTEIICRYIQINDNSYATLVYSSVDYISNIIDISREWNTHTGKKNIEILEKGFDTIAPPGELNTSI